MTHASRNKKSTHLLFQFNELAERWVKAAPIIASGNVAALERLDLESYSLFHEYAEAWCYKRYGDNSLVPEVVKRAIKRLLTSILRDDDPRRQFTGGFLCYAIRLAAWEIYRPQVRRQQREVAFSSPSDDGDEIGTLVEELPAEGDFFEALYLADFWKWVERNLSAQERKILERYVEGTAQTKIAAELEINRYRVRQTIVAVAYRWLSRSGSSFQN